MRVTTHIRSKKNGNFTGNQSYTTNIHQISNNWWTYIYLVIERMILRSLLRARPGIRLSCARSCVDVNAFQSCEHFRFNFLRAAAAVA